MDVGGLAHQGLGARFRPEVVDHAGALGLGDGNHLVEQRIAVRVADGREVLAFKLRVGRVHDHDRRQVVDPEIVTLVIAQATHDAEGLLLRGVTGQGAGRFQALVVSQHAAGGLHHVLGFLHLGLVEVVVDLIKHQGAEREQHHDGHDQDEPQASADRHTAQAIHTLSLRFYSCHIDGRHCSARPLSVIDLSHNAAALSGLV